MFNCVLCWHWEKEDETRKKRKEKNWMWFEWTQPSMYIRRQTDEEREKRRKWWSIVDLPVRPFLSREYNNNRLISTLLSFLSLTSFVCAACRVKPATAPLRLNLPLSIYSTISRNHSIHSRALCSTIISRSNVNCRKNRPLPTVKVPLISTVFSKNSNQSAKLINPTNQRWSSKTSLRISNKKDTSLT